MACSADATRSVNGGAGHPISWALCGSCGSDSFHTKYNNEEVNRLTDEAARELDPAKRAELYKQVQDITVDEVTFIPLYYPPFATPTATGSTG